MTQLRDLAAKAPKGFVKQVDKGFGNVDYLPMHQVIQILLYRVGPFAWSVGDTFASGDAKEPVAIVGTLTVMIDGQKVPVQGIGSDRDAKKAESDAMKRCAMKIGVGLELWAQEAYWLDKQLEKDAEPDDGTVG